MELVETSPHVPNLAKLHESEALTGLIIILVLHAPHSDGLEGGKVRRDGRRGRAEGEVAHKDNVTVLLLGVGG